MVEEISYKLLSDLKYDVEELKKKLNQPDARAQELILEIESLKDSIQELTTIFQKSLEEVKGEDLSKTLKEKIETISNQNETIARGMVAISDRLEEAMRKPAPLSAVPSAVGAPLVSPRAPLVSPRVPLASSGKHSFGIPPTPGRVAPKPEMEEPAEVHLPPPPLRLEKRRGIFR